ncbi:MAG: hypothetical protein JWO52_5006 [Gammaproteobacteria bacterium]|nr:hypothetical protein [Gammaproteobacteria bacterium]
MRPRGGWVQWDQRAGIVKACVPLGLRSPKALGVRKGQAHAELRTLPGSGAGGTDGAVDLTHSLGIRIGGVRPATAHAALRRAIRAQA